MNGKQLISAEDWQRIERLVSGRCSDEDVCVLEVSLKGNQAAQRLMLDYLQLHIDLSIEHRAEAASQAAIGAAAAKASDAAVAVPDSVSGLHSSASSGDHRGFGLGGTVIPVMVLGGIMMAVLLLLLPAWFARDEAGTIAAIPPREAPDPAIEVKSLRIDGSIARLDLPKVGSLIVEGPADFQLVGAMRARLNSGRIRVLVSEPTGHGFVVETPDGEVTDLGTEFSLDVSDQGGTGLVVYQGTVDLRLGESPESIEGSPVERLSSGDGVRFSRTGRLDRLMSIVSMVDAPFPWLRDDEMVPAQRSPVIVGVSDNIRAADTKKFYEIIPGGMREDARAYVDRQEHEWNGIDEHGIPEYLLGADYVKTFNNDKMRQDVEIEVVLDCPARVFILFDSRVSAPDWLTRDYRLLNERIGLDMGNSFTDAGNPITRADLGVGPGKSIDQDFVIWERVVPHAGTVKLGASAGASTLTAMYGIAATALPVAAEPMTAIEMALAERRLFSRPNRPFDFVPTRFAN